MGAVRQAGNVADEGQRQAVRSLLEETTRSVYRILADGPARSAAVEDAPDHDGDVTATSPVGPEEAGVGDAGAGS